ncbi:MAG: exodeoxyribonuclease VII large subunit [Rhodobacterales bacterium]|nr:MAG: exodeoxyribonuclease VII large subunit [Rhodobacterales bacterium]
MDLIDDPRPGENAHEFTVSEISGAVKRVIEGEFGRVRVRGEVGRVYIARSGHLYFDIKDDRSVLACVSWKGQVAAMTVRPEEGMEVVATGKMTTFGSQSKYQLNVEDVAPAGEGALMAMLEKRKKQLAAEGLFDDARKRPLPMLPELIGVVTSPTGAVIRDILHRLRERFPRKVLVWPVAVQGRDCAPQVAAAIKGFNQFTPGGALPRPDLIIVARGGGSIEDLWGFNEEIVARAAAASDIPLISAVGHETDTTLIDFVSDKRAPTPTAAAEMAVPVRMELQAYLDTNGARMARVLSQTVEARRQRLRDLERALPRPEALIAARRQQLDMGEARMPALLERALSRRRHRLAEVSGALHPRLLRARLEAVSSRLDAAGAALPRTLRQHAGAERRRLDQAAARLDPAKAQARVAQHRMALATLTARFVEAGPRQVAQMRRAVDGLSRMNESLSHQATLKRGFALVRADGDLVRSADAARAHAALEIEFSDGRVVAAPAGAPAKPAKPKAPKKDDPGQGSLF